MKCKKVQKQMILYSADELIGKENTKFQMHLDDCPKCSSLFVELESVFSLTEKKESLEPNPFLYTRIKQKLDTIDADNKNRILNPVLKKVLQPVFVSMIIATGLFLGIKLGSSFEVNQPKQTFNSQTTEFYFNDIQQEKLEVLLLKE